MNCNVVKDLIPLYIDDCCSAESAELVKAHLETCPACKALFEHMKDSSQITVSTVPAPAKPSRINAWKASILQSVLLFASFAAITVGVALEASTPSGLGNSFWAYWLVVPATGFLLSLVNWYFVQLYESKKRFSNCSWLLTLGITVCGYIWAIIHYDFLVVFQSDATLKDYAEILFGWFGNGILLTAVLCVLSKLFSGKYAALLGKE